MQQRIPCQRAMNCSARASSWVRAPASLSLPPSLQISPSTQRKPASRVAAVMASMSPVARVPASTTVVKPPRSDSRAATLLAL